VTNAYGSPANSLTAVIDVAPGPPAFTDDPLVAGTALKTVHVSELRTAVDVLRDRFGLSPKEWTDGTLGTNVTTIKAAHIAELRSALDEVFVAANRTLPTYTDPVPTAGVSLIRARYLNEIRSAVLSIW